jgi:hypothetical protein
LFLVHVSIIVGTAILSSACLGTSAPHIFHSRFKAPALRSKLLIFFFLPLLYPNFSTSHQNIKKWQVKG